jgi:hypothetical protein
MEQMAETAVRKLVEQAENKQLARSHQTLDEFFAEWLVDHVLANRAARTYEAYKPKLSMHVSPRIGKVRLAAIEPKHLRELYQRLRDVGTVTRHKDPKPRELAPNAIRDIHMMLHAAFE